MENYQKIIQDYFEKSKQHFKIADHMAYVSMTILKDNRLMIKILSELSESVKALILALLHYYHSKNLIKLYKDPVMNLKTFKEKIGIKYLTNSELNTISSILDIQAKHKESELEFVKRDKFVIFLGSRYETLTIEKLKEFLSLVRKFISNVKFD